jgi:lysophospholipase L1-like esterase
MKRVLLAVIALGILSIEAATATAQKTNWTGSWAAAPVAAPASDILSGSSGATFRDTVHLSLGGNAIRLQISNEFGAAPLKVASVHAALSAGSGAIQPATDHVVTFDGSDSIVIPTGTFVISDPIAMKVQPFADIAVSFFVPKQDGVTLSYHAFASSSNYAAPGNLTAATAMPGARKINSWYLLKGIDVDTDSRAASIVILGASITDGYNSTPDKNLRWPDDLAIRLQADPRTAQFGVLNEGISGSRILHDVTGPSALSRLDRDALSPTRAKYIIVSLGHNDIGRTFFPIRPNEQVTAEQIIWGLRQIVLRAHASRIKVLGATLSPFGRAAYYNDAGNEMRKAVNNFILTSGIFDGSIDFDRATRDPAHPERLLPAFDSGDHLHPNDAGYKAMADSIDLSLFAK